MKYRRATEDEKPSGGLIGYITCRYSLFRRILGEPDAERSDPCKVHFQWSVVFEDGMQAQIYSWLESGLVTGDDYEWHVCGDDECLVRRVAELLGKRKYTLLSERLKTLSSRDDIDEIDEIPF